MCLLGVVSVFTYCYAERVFGAAINTRGGSVVGRLLLPPPPPLAALTKPFLSLENNSCPTIFDNYLCWPSTPANCTIQQLCPKAEGTLPSGKTKPLQIFEVFHADFQRTRSGGAWRMENGTTTTKKI